MVYLMYVDQRREWRWRLFAANNRIIADSGEGYVNRADCEAAIRLVQSSYTAEIRIHQG